MTVPGPATAEALRAQVAEVLDVPAADLGEHDDLLETGLDSIRLMTVVEWFRHHDVQIEFTDLAETPTIAAWTSILGTATGAGQGVGA